MECIQDLLEERLGLDYEVEHIDELAADIECLFSQCYDADEDIFYEDEFRDELVAYINDDELADDIVATLYEAIENDEL